MHTEEKSGWVQSSSEMLAGLLGGINAIAAWLIILGAVFAGFAALSAASEAGLAAMLLSGAGLVAVGVVFAAILCGLVAMLYVIMAQARYQSSLMRQIHNQQNRQTEILEAQRKLMQDGLA